MAQTFQGMVIIYGIPYAVEVDADTQAQAVGRIADTMGSQVVKTAAVVHPSPHVSTVPKGH